jgi:methionine-rich copper-binding protein CopC
MKPVNLSTLGMLAALVLGSTAPAWAHAHPSMLMPAANSVLSSPPKEVMVMFDEEVTGGGVSHVEVKDNGRIVSTGKGTVDKTHKNLTVQLAKAGAGKYVVTWKALASDDGHMTHGTYSFTVKPGVKAKAKAKPKSSKK